MYYTILHHTTLYYTIPNYTIPYYTTLYYTILYYTILYYTILYYYYTMLLLLLLLLLLLYYTILYYTILYYTIASSVEFPPGDLISWLPAEGCVASLAPRTCSRSSAQAGFGCLDSLVGPPLNCLKPRDLRIVYSYIVCSL